MILTNNENTVSDIQYLPQIGLSDHICITFDSILCAKHTKIDIPRYAYHNGNYDKIIENLKSVHWQRELNSNIEDDWTRLNEFMEEQKEKYIPKSRHKRHRPYLNREVERKKKVFLVEEI